MIYYCQYKRLHILVSGHWSDLVIDKWIFLKTFKISCFINSYFCEHYKDVTRGQFLTLLHAQR